MKPLFLPLQRPEHSRPEMLLQRSIPVHNYHVFYFWHPDVDKTKVAYCILCPLKYYCEDRFIYLYLKAG